jgi:galactokinase
MAGRAAEEPALSTDLSTSAALAGGARALEARVEGLKRAFLAEFGAAPQGVWGAPGRVNLIGEHTDYNDGFALPLGIEQRALVAARRRDDASVRLASAQVTSPEGRQVLRCSELGPGHVSGWAMYVAGSAWAALEDGARGSGFDLLLDSDVPMGAGLSSSAAVECATLVALADLWGFARSPLELARLAQRAEVEVAGVPCGLMDQMASMFARPGHALSIDFRSLAVEAVPLPLDAAGLALLVLDTRAPHQLAEGAYAERRRSCQEAARALEVGSLRDATLESLARLDPRSVSARRARHVISENERVRRSLELLRAASGPRQAASVAQLGPLLSASHASLRDDFEVSVPRLDVAAAVAERAGALGARMVGGGFGGCVLALVQSGDVPRVSDAVAAAYAVEGWELPRAFPVVPGQGAARLA